MLSQCRYALLAAAAAMAAAWPAGASEHEGAEIDSAYSELDWQAGCTILDRAGADEPGAWAQLVCQGHRGYPVFVAEDDLRMSLAYGFAGGPSAWESFAGFNRVHDTIEWRLAAAPSGKRPFATIHRWLVSDGQGGEDEVLAVSTVAQPEGGDSCVVGYVEGGANAEANRLARRVADELARDFRCGVDEPRYHGATTPGAPQPVRAERD